MDSLTHIQCSWIVRSGWRVFEKLCGGVTWLHLHDPWVFHISLVRAEAAQPGENPSHLPRTLLSRWSRAAWRCHRKSPLWQPCGTGRQIQSGRLTRRRTQSQLNNTIWCTPETLPFPCLVDTYWETLTLCKSHFCTWLSTSFASTGQRNDRERWHSQSESLSVIYGHHGCLSSKHQAQQCDKGCSTWQG